jgi:type I restriction enzyme R subunit
LEHLKAAVRAQLERLVRSNRTRADYLEKFRELIDSYNAGSRNIEEIFKELLDLSSVLTKEQTRHVRENLTEEELTIFDILTRPGPDLTNPERDEVKKVARQLLDRLKELLVIGWRQRVGSARACAIGDRRCFGRWLAARLYEASVRKEMLRGLRACV